MNKTQACYPAELRELCVRIVFGTRASEESLKAVDLRVTSLVNVRFATLYGWCKVAVNETCERDCEGRSNFFRGGDLSPIPAVAAFFQASCERVGVDPICEVLRVPQIVCSVGP